MATEKKDKDKGEEWALLLLLLLLGGGAAVWWFLRKKEEEPPPDDGNNDVVQKFEGCEPASTSGQISIKYAQMAVVFTAMSNHSWTDFELNLASRHDYSDLWRECYIDIHNAVNNVPINQPLYTTPIWPGDCPSLEAHAWLRFSIPPMGIVQGQQYAIVMRCPDTPSTDGGISWQGGFVGPHCQNSNKAHSRDYGVTWEPLFVGEVSYAFRILGY